MPAAAQNVVNPSLLEFNPSADHNTIRNGVSLLDHYELEIFRQNQASLLQSIAVGRPEPDADGKIRIDFAMVSSSTLVPGEFYVADIVAVGPGGRAASALSPNSFYIESTCTYLPSELTQSVSSAGGSGVIGVTSGTGCTWTAEERITWLTITGGSSGSGSGAVNYTATANTSFSPRSATLMVAGVGVVITQAGAACTYGASPASQSFAAGGGTAAITVTAQTGCAWTATETAGWLAIKRGASGSGNGTISYTTTANTSTTARTTTLMVGATSVAITQAGASCNYGTSPGSQSFAAAGGAATVAVTAGAGCTWTTSEEAAWLTIASAASGSGDGTVSYTAAANTSTTSRTANLTVAGRIIGVTQAGTECSYSASPLSQSFAEGGGTATVDVTTANGCAWTATRSATWLTIGTGTSGLGGGTVSYTASANTSTAFRTATLTVAGQTITVTQAGAGCSFVVVPANPSFGTAGGDATVTVTTTVGCNWTAAENAKWLNFTSASTGSTTGTVSYTVAANPSANARSTILTVAGRAVIVNQAGTGTLSDSNDRHPVKRR